MHQTLEVSIMEYEQIMMIHQKTGDKKYAKFLSDEGWKYDTETDALAGYARLIKAEQKIPLTWEEFWSELQMEGDLSAAQKLYRILRRHMDNGALNAYELYGYARHRWCVRCPEAVIAYQSGPYSGLTPNGALRPAGSSCWVRPTTTPRIGTLSPSAADAMTGSCRTGISTRFINSHIQTACPLWVGRLTILTGGQIVTIMYRTETYSGSLERRFAHVLCYELFTLGNAHILNELIQNELVRNSDLIIEMESMGRELEENGYGDDMSELDQLEFWEKVRLDISAQAGRDIQYALWLADKACVQRFYGGTDSDIESYETSDVILSDLGRGGTLFGYELEPLPCAY